MQIVVFLMMLLISVGEVDNNKHSKFLHYLLVPSLHIINVANTGNQKKPVKKLNNPRGVLVPVFSSSDLIELGTSR